MKWMLAVLLLAGVAVLGWTLGRRTASPSATEPRRESATASTPTGGARKKRDEGNAESRRGAGAGGQSPAVLSAEVSRELREGTPEKRDHALYQLFPRLVALDRTEAARLALAWERGTLRDEMLRQTVRCWLEKDAPGALKWITGLSDAADRALAGAAAVDFLAKNDPASAIELALALGIETQDGSVEHRAQIWAEENLTEAEAWVVARPAGLDRDRLLARVALVKAQKNPAGAASLVLNQMGSGAARDDAILGVVQRWAALDTAEATQWVSQLPPGSLFDRAVVVIGTFSK